MNISTARHRDAGLSVLLMTLLVVLSGCAGQRQVIVDQRGTDPVLYQRDRAECEAYARQLRSGEKVAGKTAGGAVVGGAVGAAAGNSTTAQRGAGVGAVLGFFRGLGGASREQHMVVKRCLSGRGYRVLN